jgi:hypothetical protein
MTKLEIAGFDHIVRETSDIGKHAHARGGGAINVSSETQRIIDQVGTRRVVCLCCGIDYGMR